jgi:hypothetical protein
MKSEQFDARVFVDHHELRSIPHGREVHRELGAVLEHALLLRRDHVD